MIAEEVKSEVFVFDDKWETYPSSGIPNRNSVPHFEDDLAYLRSRGLKVGLWQAVGWLDVPEEGGINQRRSPLRSGWQAEAGKLVNESLTCRSRRTIASIRVPPKRVLTCVTESSGLCATIMSICSNLILVTVFPAPMLPSRATRPTGASAWPIALQTGCGRRPRGKPEHHPAMLGTSAP